ncbi:uncharacterized protein LOC106693952 [Microplitis demolitor]|uniref:uncharacterized protein LOC106693952 n=1 Tax=Microplitis demolitor TaxID=69319 RepID=UPI0006D523C8|nr:uncharacterized protein LOC106693952 [Microplitis demolitor]
MKSQSVIQPTSSPWASPVVFKKKKDETLRFCVDYRQLNSVTKKTASPISHQLEIIDFIVGTVWISVVDFKIGYWQVRMNEKDREKTTFCISSKTFSEHLEHLEIIFDGLLQAGLKINTKKFVFFQHKVSFLGHVISGDKIECDSKKVESIANWPTPKNKTDLQGFLGLCSYYRRYMKNFSLIAKDLYKLTEEKVQFIWDDKAHQAFENLKKALSTAPVLTPPDPNLPFILDTDASYFQLGAVLSQVHRINTPIKAPW